MWFFKTVPSVSATDAKQKVGIAGVAFIDVRTPEEYATGHAVGAQNIPLATLDDAAITRLKQFKEVYAICRSGGRSSTVASKLVAAKVNAFTVTGGTNAWRESGLPIA